LLAAFAIRRTGDVALDPSCGDGRLLDAARDAKIALGQASGPTRSVIESEAGQGSPRARRRGDLFGIDRSDKAVAQAARIGAQVAVSDFFEVRPGARISGALTLPLEFDAIIGNPPYIRQELLGEHKSRINRLFGRGMNLKGADAGPSHRR